jgi:hypothetical protein
VEAGQFFNGDGVGPGEAQVAALAAYEADRRPPDGAISLQSTESADYPLLLRHRFILDYLVEEVLGARPKNQLF